MKFNNIPGDHAFKALYRTISYLPWELTKGYFLNQKEVTVYLNEQQRMGYDTYEIIWPVEILDNGIIYVPTQEELE